jgi:hypothetical protein
LQIRLRPELALQVDFPRLEIVLEGSVEDRAAPFYSKVMSFTSRWRLELPTMANTRNNAEHSVW